MPPAPAIGQPHARPVHTESYRPVLLIRRQHHRTVGTRRITHSSDAHSAWAILDVANFYEKALFVKVDLATALWWTRLFPALRAMLLFALPVSQLSSDSVHYGIRLDSS
jgi:hypothetical protein